MCIKVSETETNFLEISFRTLVVLWPYFGRTLFANILTGCNLILIRILHRVRLIDVCMHILRSNQSNTS